MGYETIEFTKQGAVGILTLNRPKCLNAVDHVMRDELRAVLTGLPADDTCRVLVLTGAGRGFSGGLDLRDATLVDPSRRRTPEAAYRAQRSFTELILMMRRCPQPIVGAINGAAVGVGLALASACDIRLAVPEARFQAAYINLGLGGADLGSSWLLPRAMGTANAARYLLTGDFLSADEALRTGFVQELVPADRLLEQALALAAKIATKSALGLRLTKEALDTNAAGVSLEAAIQLEDRNQAMCIVELVAK